MTSLFEILKASKGLPVDDMYAALLGRAAGGVPAVEHEYTGAVPYTFTADGSPLISWRISGNTVQSATPTPQNPVMPQGTGERTGNLWQNLPNRTAVGVDISSENGVIYFTNTATSSFNVEYSIALPAGTYTIKANANRIPANDENACIQVYNGSAQVYTKVNNNAAINGTATFTINQNLTVSLRIRLQNGVDYTGFELRPTLNSGSTAMDFEPYGYKLDISSGDTATPVYLGEVETTRQIKKLALDGTETGWRKGSTFFFNQELSPDYLRVRDIITCMCSHYQAYQQVGSGSNVPEGYCSLYYAPEVQRLYIKDSNFATLEDFTTYLAAQYANGTPVCVWYVLAEPETGIINEPLMKIGDYADEVANVATIPTNNGSTTIDVETAVKPSEVYIKYTV